MSEKQTWFQQYLEQNNITFEEYHEWFKKLKVGDSTCRYKHSPDDVSKIVEVSEVGVRFVGKTSQDVLVFYGLDLTKRTVFLRYSDKTIDNPENFPTLSEIDLMEFRHLHKSTIFENLFTCCLSSISEDQIHDALSSGKKEEEMSGRRPKPPLPQKNNEEEEKTSLQIYLEKNDLTFEEYEKWFGSVKEGDLVERLEGQALKVTSVKGGALSVTSDSNNYRYAIENSKAVFYVAPEIAQRPPIPSEKEIEAIKSRRSPPGKSSFNQYLEEAGVTFEEYKKWFESLKQGQEVSKYMLSDPYLIAGAKNCEISFPGCYYFIREEEIYVKSSSTCSFARFFPIPSEEEVSQIKQKRDQIRGKVRPPLAIGQEWQTKECGKGTVVGFSEGTFFVWIHCFCVLTLYSDSSSHLYEIKAFDLVEYLGETSRPRLKIDEQYFTEDGGIVQIKERLKDCQKNSYRAIAFQDYQGNLYFEFGFRGTNPITRQLTEEEKAQLRKPAPIFTLPLSEETKNQKEEVMSNQIAQKQEQTSNNEYPVIEIKDVSPGDLIEDPFGNLFVYGDGALFDQSGKCQSYSDKLEYKLIEKRKYVRPLDVMFTYTGEGREELKSSYVSARAWFATCAKLGKEPEIVERRLMIPSFSQKIASFQSRTDASKFIDSQREPQLYALALGNDETYWVTKDFIKTATKLPVNNSIQESLELQLKNEKEVSAELRSRIKDYDTKVDEHSFALAKEKITTSALKEQVKALKEQIKHCLETLDTSDKQYAGRIDSLKTLLAKETAQLLEVSQKLKDITNLHEGAKHINKTLLEDNEILKENLRKSEVEVGELRQKFQDLSIALNNC